MRACVRVWVALYAYLRACVVRVSMVYVRVWVCVRVQARVCVCVCVCLLTCADTFKMCLVSYVYCI